MIKNQDGNKMLKIRAKGATARSDRRVSDMVWSPGGDIEGVKQSKNQGSGSNTPWAVGPANYYYYFYYYHYYYYYY